MTDATAQATAPTAVQRLRLAVLRTVIGLIGIVSLVRRRRAARRPTAAELMAMDDEKFEAFVHEIGLKTISTSPSVHVSAKSDRP